MTCGCKQNPCVCYQPTFANIAAFVMPACNQGVAVQFSGRPLLLVGTYIFNPTYGYLFITSYDGVTGTANLVNQCDVGNAAPGTTIPPCTPWLSVDAPSAAADCSTVRNCISIADTNSIDMHYDAGTGVISADSKISVDVGNTIAIHADGLFSAGGGGGCCCQSWVENLCYTVIPPENFTLVYREQADLSNEGFYNPYTWSPNAPYINPGFTDFPAKVHANLTDHVTGGNGCFNADYTRFYSFSGTTLKTVDVTNPAAPVVLNNVTIQPWTSFGFSPVIRVDNICVDPVTDILWMSFVQGDTIARPIQCFSTLDPFTGVTGPGCNFGFVNPVTDPPQLILFDLTGQAYEAENNQLFTFNLGACNAFVNIWSLAAGEIIVSFMGYAGGGKYGFVIYNSNTDTWRNDIVDISTGTVSDTLASVERAVFFKPGNIPSIVIPFARVFNVDCDGVLTFTNRDIVTGDIIIIPDGATVGVCP